MIHVCKLQHALTVALILVCGGAWAGQIIVPPQPTVNLGGPFSLVGTGTSGSYDAQVAALNGGSTPLQGDLTLTAAAQHHYGYDGSEQLRVLTTFGSTEIWRFQGGIPGHGPLMIADSSVGAANVNGTFAALGTGDIRFENQYGTLLHLYNPAVTVLDNLKITGGGYNQYGATGGALFIEGEGVDSSMSIGIIPLGYGAILARKPDGGQTAQGGASPGQNSVDLQLSRTASQQVASGANAVAVGGAANVVSGGASVAIGGYGNVVDGSYGGTVSGQNGAAKGEYGKLFFSTGLFSQQGDAQLSLMILRGTTASTTAARLTGNGAAASSSAKNCINLKNFESRLAEISLIGRTRGIASNWYSWVNTSVVISQDGLLSTTAVSAGTPVVLSGGSGSGVTVSATADTTNGCLNLTATPPSGNSSTWDFAARVVSTEVQ